MHRLRRPLMTREGGLAWIELLSVLIILFVFPLFNVLLAGGNLSFMQGSASLGLVYAAAFATKALAMPLTVSVTSALYARLCHDQLASWGWRILAPLELVQLAATGLIGVG